MSAPTETHEPRLPETNGAQLLNRTSRGKVDTWPWSSQCDQVLEPSHFPRPWALRALLLTDTFTQAFKAQPLSFSQGRHGYSGGRHFVIRFRQNTTPVVFFERSVCPLTTWRPNKPGRSVESTRGS